MVGSFYGRHQSMNVGIYHNNLGSGDWIKVIATKNGKQTILFEGHRLIAGDLRWILTSVMSMGPIETVMNFQMTDEEINNI